MPGNLTALDPAHDRFIVAASGPIAETDKRPPVEVWQLSTNSLITRILTFRTSLHCLLLDEKNHQFWVGDGSASYDIIHPKEGGMIINQNDPATAIRSYDLRTGQPLLVLDGSLPGKYINGTRALALSPDSTLLVALRAGALESAALFVWNARDGHLLNRYNFGSGYLAHGLAFSSDGRFLAYGLDSTVHILSVNPSLTP